MATCDGETVVVEAHVVVPIPVGLVMSAQLLMAVAGAVPNGIVVSKTSVTELLAGTETFVAVRVCPVTLQVAPAGQVVTVGAESVAGTTSVTVTPVAGRPAVSVMVIV